MQKISLKITSVGMGAAKCIVLVLYTKLFSPVLCSSTLPAYVNQLPILSRQQLPLHSVPIQPSYVFHYQS